jgi:adenylate kinase
MRLVFLGAPGVGKGTQAKLLSQEKEIPHISTGDMLRVAIKGGSSLGLKVKSIIDSGQLVPDALIIELVRERTKEGDCKNGYIFDGFPRTIPQAEALNEILSERGKKLDFVICFELEESEILKRLAGRREAESRVDDDQETQKKRLEVYNKQTAPLIDFYQQGGLLKMVDASGSMEQVFKKTLSAIG